MLTSKAPSVLAGAALAIVILGARARVATYARPTRA
jgi:hypothetical protein